MKYFSLFFKIVILLWAVGLITDGFYKNQLDEIDVLFADSFRKLWIKVLAALIVVFFIFLKQNNINNETDE